MKEKVRAFFMTDWTMSEKWLLVADVFLLGVLIGWLTSPIKKGIGLFSNNSWAFKSPCCEEDEVEEE